MNQVKARTLVETTFVALACASMAACLPDGSNGGGGGGGSSQNNTSNNATTNNVSNNESNNVSNNVTSNNVTANNTGGVCSDEVDILWVIDNSGSMCQEQKRISEHFGAFLSTLEGKDVHIAITTTHAPGADANYEQEPVAIEGHIQSEPQPLPGFDNVCLGTYDSVSRSYTDLTPIRDALATAVGCMETPDASLLAVTDAQINCALPDSAVEGCAEALGATDRDGDGSFTIDDVFPQRSEYRTIPKVLNTSAYIDSNGDFERDRLIADFTCAALVGTRGYGLEKGLQAAVEAVSPSLTSGANAGFLRPDASFGLVFVTDENDCSHDGDIVEFAQVCRGAICDYENSSQLSDEESNLTSISTLAQRLRDNLAASKGRAVSDSEIVVTSIHGSWKRFDGPMPECEVDETPEVEDACSAPLLGRAFSGDRYERFMRQFPSYYPNAVTGGDEAKRLDFENHKEAGAICTGNFDTTFTAIGSLIASSNPRCP